MSLTKQDVQSCMDNTRMRLLDHVPSRQDIQSLKDATRTLMASLNQNQQLNQQFLYQGQRSNAELIRRTMAMESRIGQLEHELRDVRRVMSVLASHRPLQRITERVIVAGTEERERTNYGLSPTPYNA